MLTKEWLVIPYTSRQLALLVFFMLPLRKATGWLFPFISIHSFLTSTTSVLQPIACTNNRLSRRRLSPHHTIVNTICKPCVHAIGWCISYCPWPGIYNSQPYAVNTKSD
ncbi:hypothetical protein F4823DRAFT_603235 [Ustulina deusta]|nr:hypothetical protein F4823DRAFT_603235 [Ustulina deusta]